MNRRINTVSLQAANGGGGGKPDSYSDRIVKFIPSEVVAGWLAVTTAIKSAAQPPNECTMWIIFAAGLLFAAAWTWRQTSEAGKKPPYIQITVSTIAFFVWAYATGGGLPQWPGTIYQPLTATLMLVGFSLLSGLVTKA
jgi:hypothetical protein